jgi:hypothetical protein
MFHMFKPNKSVIIAVCVLFAAGPVHAGLLGGGGGLSVGAEASVGGIGASADAGLGGGGGVGASADVGLGGSAGASADIGLGASGTSASVGVGVTKPSATANATTAAATSKAAKAEAARINMLLALKGSTVVDRRGLDIGVISAISETDAGKYRVRMELADSLPRDAALVTISRLDVRGDELWLPISRSSLVSSLN